MAFPTAKSHPPSLPIQLFLVLTRVVLGFVSNIQFFYLGSLTQVDVG